MIVILSLNTPQLTFRFLVHIWDCSMLHLIYMYQKLMYLILTFHMQIQMPTISKKYINHCIKYLHFSLKWALYSVMTL